MVVSEGVVRYLYFVTEIYVDVYALAQHLTSFFCFVFYENLNSAKKAGAAEMIRITDRMVYQWFSGISNPFQ
jgi:hypothetical protein